MRLLLDTHTMYWYIEGDPKLSATAQTLVRDAANEVLISPASYWEIAIKVSIGKWIMNRPYEEFIDLGLNQYGFQVLPILPIHTAKLIGLPFPPNHKDPFGRLIVAQAMVEQIAVVSVDAKWDAYPITRLWQAIGTRLRRQQWRGFSPHFGAGLGSRSCFNTFSSASIA